MLLKIVLRIPKFDTSIQNYPEGLPRFHVREECFAPLAALSLSVAEVGCEALSFDSRVHPDTMRGSKFVWAFDRSV